MWLCAPDLPLPASLAGRHAVISLTGTMWAVCITLLWTTASSDPGIIPRAPFMAMLNEDEEYRPSGDSMCSSLARSSISSLGGESATPAGAVSDDSGSDTDSDGASRNTMMSSRGPSFSLPPGWSRFEDLDTGLPYFHNEVRAASAARGVCVCRTARRSPHRPPAPPFASSLRS